MCCDVIYPLRSRGISSFAGGEIEQNFASEGKDAPSENSQLWETSRLVAENVKGKTVELSRLRLRCRTDN
jgi:hypothetical protein